MHARKFREDSEGISHVIEFITSFIIFVILLAAFYAAVGVQFPKSNLVDLNDRMKLVRVGNMLISEDGQILNGSSNWEDFVGSVNNLNNIGRIGFACSDHAAGVLSLKKIDAINTVLNSKIDPVIKELYNKTSVLMGLETGQHFNLQIYTLPGYIRDASFEEDASASRWTYSSSGNWADHFEGERGNSWSTEGKNSYVLSWKPVYDCKEAAQPFFLYNTSTQSSRIYYVAYDGGNARVLSAHSTDNLTWIKDDSVKINVGGSYDRVNATSPFVLKLLDNSYRMYYAGNDSIRSRVLSATSADGGITWIKESGIRLDKGNTYDSNRVSTPFVYKYSETSYRMYYSGYDGTNWRILNATSIDGITWTKPSAPNTGISIDTDGTYDKLHAYSPCVIKLPNNTFQMFYVGVDASLHSNITSAWSSDSVTWTKSNIASIRPSTVNMNVSSPNVVALPNGYYRMYYTESDGVNSHILSALSKSAGDMVKGIWTKEDGVRVDNRGAATGAEFCKITTPSINLTNTMEITFDIGMSSATQKNIFNYSVVLSNSTSSQVVWSKTDIDAKKTLSNVSIKTSNKVGWYTLEVRMCSALSAGEYASESVERKINIDNFCLVGEKLLEWGKSYEKADQIHSYNRIVTIYDEDTGQYTAANLAFTLFRGIAK